MSEQSRVGAFVKVYEAVHGLSVQERAAIFRAVDCLATLSENPVAAPRKSFTVGVVKKVQCPACGEHLCRCGRCHKNYCEACEPKWNGECDT